MKMEARLLEKGYKIWERTDCNGKHYKRIYINDFSKDIDIFQISSIEIDSPIYKNIFSEGITIYDSKYNH